MKILPSTGKDIAKCSWWHKIKQWVKNHVVNPQVTLQYREKFMPHNRGISILFETKMQHATLIALILVI